MQFFVDLHCLVKLFTVVSFKKLHKVTKLVRPVFTKSKLMCDIGRPFNLLSLSYTVSFGKQ